MKKVGFIGWRGMVGSVLMDRMKSENDFQGFEPIFFSTSQVGQSGPKLGDKLCPLSDAHDRKALAECDVLVSCQGGSYTEHVFPELRRDGWRGIWIDAASTLRMQDDCVIVLDPVNRKVIDRALDAGIGNYIGANCTVSIMLMGMGVLLEQGLVEWISAMTYQAASGAGAKHMRELLKQMAVISDANRKLLDDPAVNVLDIERLVTQTIRAADFPQDNFKTPLACSLIPWIDREVSEGMTREEWKGAAETNKILALDPPVPVDGLCVRIAAMRCHSLGLTIKLKRNIPLPEIEAMIAQANDWVKLVPNSRAETEKHLAPAAVSGTLSIAVGRVRKLSFGPEYLGAFVVGDQLLWGAAEPLRRMLKIALG